MTRLETEVFDVFGDDTAVYPGHGDDTTLGEGTATAGGMARARLVTVYFPAVR